MCVRIEVPREHHKSIEVQHPVTIYPKKESNLKKINIYLTTRSGK
jgi:hypothetical protein